MMILLSQLIAEYGDALRRDYQDRLLPSHYRALDAMKQCRTQQSLLFMAQCEDCCHQTYYPHSCGHRACPHCQCQEGEQWLERQRRKLLPVNYFMVTFTLPAQLRPLAWQHQRLIYSLLFSIGWEVLQSFGLKDKKLSGKLGATAVLHTHSRALDYHPHVHFIVPAGALDQSHKLWRKKHGRYLFNHHNLARVFKAKWFAALKENKLEVSETLPDKWVADCKQVGQGDKALRYLGRYLYRGVIQEKQIIKNHEGNVTFSYVDNTNSRRTRTLSGAAFLWLLLKHVLPRGFRRARDFGFLHGNSKRLIHLLHLMLGFVTPISKESGKTTRGQFCCSQCGGFMRVIDTRLPNILRPQTVSGFP